MKFWFGISNHWLFTNCIVHVLVANNNSNDLSFEVKMRPLHKEICVKEIDTYLCVTYNEEDENSLETQWLQWEPTCQATYQFMHLHFTAVVSGYFPMDCKTIKTFNLKIIWNHFTNLSWEITATTNFTIHIPHSLYNNTAAASMYNLDMGSQSPVSYYSLFKNNIKITRKIKQQNTRCKEPNLGSILATSRKTPDPGFASTSHSMNTIRDQITGWFRGSN